MQEQEIKHKKVYLISKNGFKIAVAKRVFSRFGIDVVPIPGNAAEIQADTSAEIARFAALQAVRGLDAPVIREDHSLVFNSLGLPGPYTKFMESKLPEEKLLKILELFPDRSGYFELSAAYAHPDDEVMEFTFRVPINVANEPRGKLSKGWNRVLMLVGESRTLAEYQDSDRISVFEKNFVRIAEHMKSKGD